VLSKCKSSKFQPASIVISIGQEGGLDMADFVNASEWTYGPRMPYYGIRVTVHAPETQVHFLRDKGFSIVPGYTTDVTIARREVQLLVKAVLQFVCPCIVAQFSVEAHGQRSQALKLGSRQDICKDDEFNEAEWNQNDSDV